MKKIINTAQAPAAIGTYSQAVVYGDTLYVSGQIGLDPATGEFVSADFKEQAQRAFENVNAIVTSAGTDLSHTIKLNISVIDMAQFSQFNEVMGRFFSEPYPARACVGVRELPKGALVEIEAIVGMSDG